MTAAIKKKKKLGLAVHESKIMANTDSAFSNTGQLRGVFENWLPVILSLTKGIWKLCIQWIFIADLLFVTHHSEC